MIVGEGPFVTMNVRGDQTLPKVLRKRARTRGFKSVGDYLRHLIDQDSDPETDSTQAPASKNFDQAEQQNAHPTKSLDSIEEIDTAPVVVATTG